MATDFDNSTSVDFATTLAALGFSQYEARCYVGLLGPGPQTGYAVSKTTGVPQPKVYEALRKLVARGAAAQLPGEPVRFAAVPPVELLDMLAASFDERVGAARDASRLLDVASIPARQEPVAALSGLEDVTAQAARALSGASRRVYLSATNREIGALRDPIRDAAKRGIDIVVLCFGKMPFRVEGVRLFSHSSTDGTLYRHHQARHVALVVDSRETVFGLAPDGKTWAGIHTDSAPIIAAVKGYIRHDIDMQQVFGDFREELTHAYGPGLQKLESYRGDPVPTSSRLSPPEEQHSEDEAERSDRPRRADRSA